MARRVGWVVLLLLVMAAGAAVAKPKDDGFYEYKDDRGETVLVQGFKNVPEKFRSSVKEITVSADRGEAPEHGPVYLERSDVKPTSTCADKDVRRSWAQMVPKTTVARGFTAVSVVGLLGFAIWLFRTIKLVVWLRALLTMAPFLVAAGGLWVVADRMAAWRQCDQASGITKKLLEAHTARLEAMDRAIERETR